MREKLIKLFGGKVYLALILFLSIVAAFLRLYKIHDFATFLGDQGRDAIIMRNIVTLRDFPALGPITSVGSIYLGPLYYYLMAPWLLLTGFDPIGPSMGVALLSTVAVVLTYLALKKIFDRQIAAVSAIFITFSGVLVEYSRFSWNPNLLPPVTLFVVVSLILLKQTGKLRYAYLLGALLSVAVQLHYLAVFLLPFAGIGLLVKNNPKKKSSPTLIKSILATGSTFVLFLAPFLIFEIKHRFPNGQSVLRFMGENSSSNHTSFINELMDTAINMVRFATNLPHLPVWIATVTLIAIVGIALYGFVKKQIVGVFALALLTMIIGTSFYHGPKFAHYLGATYILFYVLVSYVLIQLKKFNRMVGSILTIIILLGFVKIQIPQYTFLFNIPSRQIDTAQEVARAVYAFHPHAPYALTSSPESYSDHSYRYFLDLWGTPPVAKEQDAYIPTQELYVICEKKCDPMGDPQWTIAHFNATKVLATKHVAGHFVYKLTK